jgi:hypothetical protein
MRIAAFVLVAGSAVCCAGVAQAGGEALNGSWAGQMRQVDVDRETTYPMTLTIKGAKGTTSYPSLKCSGTLARVATTKAGYAIYQETIKNDPGGTCIDGIVTVTRNESGDVVLGWFAEYAGTPSLASAVLGREGK